MYLINNRLRFLFRWYKSIGLYSIVPLIIFSLLIFQENQSLCCATIICCIHFYRKDILLIQTAYGDDYKLILFFEYFLLYLFYFVIGVFVKDSLIFYSPLIFILILCFLNFYKQDYIYNTFRNVFLEFLINYKDFIWRSGLRSSSFKLLIIFLFFLPLIIGTKNIYIYSVFLFSLFLVVFNFYLPEISRVHLDLINSNLKKSILTLYKKNIVSLLTLIFLPTVIQLGLFYDNKLVLYSMSSLIICFYLIFQFLVVNIYSYQNKKSIAFIQLLNGFSIICIIIPPIGIVLAVYLNRMLKNLN